MSDEDMWSVWDDVVVSWSNEDMWSVWDKFPDDVDVSWYSCIATRKQTLEIFRRRPIPELVWLDIAAEEKE